MVSATEQLLDVRRQGVRRPISLLAVGSLLRLVDALTIILIGYLCEFAVEYWKADSLQASYSGPILVGTLVALITFERFGLYNQKNLLTGLLKIHRLLFACLVTVGVLLFIAFAFKITASYSRIWATSWMTSTFILLFAFRAAIHVQITRMAERGRFATRTVIVGTGEQGRRLASQIKQFGWPYVHLIGFVDDRESRTPDRLDDLPVLGRTSELIGLIQKGMVDEVVLALPWSAERRLMELIERFSASPVHVRLSPDLVGFNFPNRSTRSIAQVPVLSVFDRPISGWSHAVKRIEDIILSCLALIFLAPLLLVIAVLVKLDSRGPVFFRQPRYGFNNSVIEVLKFRTMYHDLCDGHANKLATRDDPRVTRVGRFLRRSSLDELPQLFNVLSGAMSLVGPRPHATLAKADGQLYQDVVDDYAARHKVKPGITGWAQVNGWRGETDTIEKIRKRVEHDLYYIDNWSVWLDLQILARTILVIWNDENAY